MPSCFQWCVYKPITRRPEGFVMWIKDSVYSVISVIYPVFDSYLKSDHLYHFPC